MSELRKTPRFESRNIAFALLIALFVTGCFFVFFALRYYENSLNAGASDSLIERLANVFQQLFCTRRRIALFGAVSLVLFCATGVASLFYFKKKEQANSFLFRFRYAIALVLLGMCVVLELNGSSIGEWVQALPQGENVGLILGRPRSCRTDEFALFTGMTFAQYYDPQGSWPFIGQVMSGTSTDMFMVYGQPVLNPAIIFRPFQIGYLFLGLSHGLSFYWCSRLIALFMSSFEFGRVITKDNRPLSVAFACLCALAPAVAWWFSINSLVEMLVFFNIIFICFSKYPTQENVFKRRVIIAICAYACVGFLFSIYPAWQVPLAYVLLALLIAVVVTVKTDFAKCLRGDAWFVALCAVVAIASVVAVLLQSSDAILKEMNTDYPGDRIDAGGSWFLLLFRFPISLFLSFIPSAENSGLIVGRPDSLTTFFDFFPLGIVLAIINFKHEKKVNSISVALIVVIVFIGIYESVGFPEIVAKFTMMGKSIPTRAIVIFSFANLILLFYELARFKHLVANYSFKQKAQVVCASVGICVCLTLLCRLNDEAFLGMLKLIPIFVVLLIVWLSVFYGKRNLFLATCVVVAVITGAFVNPIQRGIAVVDENPLITQIRTISQENSGAKWISAVGWRSNITLFSGAPAINSTNIYPNEDLWKVLDPDGTRKLEWNRYAHLPSKIVSESEGSSFVNTSLDSISLRLTLSDLQKLDVEYIVAEDSEMSLTDEEMQQLEVVSTFGTTKIYELR